MLHGSLQLQWTLLGIICFWKKKIFVRWQLDGWVITAFHALMSLSNSTLSCRFEDRFMRSSEWEAVVTCPVVTHQYPSKIVLETISIFRLDMMMWSPWPSRPSGSTPWIWEAPWSGALRLMTLGETMGTNILWSPQSRGSWTGDKYFLVSSCKIFSKVEKLLILILFLEKMMHVKLHQAAGEATIFHIQKL